MNPHDKLPTSSRWRQIPEPPPLIVEPAKPAVTPRRVRIVAAMILCVISGIAVFLKSNHAPSASPIERRHSALDSPIASTRSHVHEPPVRNHLAPQVVPVLTEDDRRIDEVLRLHGGNPDPTNTAQVLINLLPALTAQGQIESARHIANLLPDAEYQRVMPLWRNAQANRDVLEILGADLMNRDPKIMLPAMLEALRQPVHPFHESGREVLAIFLDGDCGNDFAKWNEALEKFQRQRILAARAGGG